LRWCRFLDRRGSARLCVLGVWGGGGLLPRSLRRVLLLWVRRRVLHLAGDTYSNTYKLHACFGERDERRTFSRILFLRRRGEGRVLRSTPSTLLFRSRSPNSSCKIYLSRCPLTGRELRDGWGVSKVPRPFSFAVRLSSVLPKK